MPVVDMMHKVFWDSELEVDDEEETADVSLTSSVTSSRSLRALTSALNLIRKAEGLRTFCSAGSTKSARYLFRRYHADPSCPLVPGFQ
jgi:hypothetical protein